MLNFIFQEMGFFFFFSLTLSIQIYTYRIDYNRDLNKKKIVLYAIYDSMKSLKYAKHNFVFEFFVLLKV